MDESHNRLLRLEGSKLCNGSLELKGPQILGYGNIRHVILEHSGGSLE
jgi:hypothetical protein